MLTLLSGASAFGAVLAATRLLRGGVLLFVAGIVLAVGLGLLAVVTAHLAGARGFRRVVRAGDSPRADAVLRLLYLAKFVWCVALAPLLSFAIADSALRIFL